MKNKVSIIISVFNGEKTFEKCLQSILLQTYNNYELIIIDGGSNDKTLEIINKYSKHITHWQSEKDNGIYDAWNKALKYVKGEWVCFIGSDDFLKPNGLINLITIENLNKYNLISAKVEMIDNENKIIESIGKKWNFKNLYKGLGIVHCGALHHISLFKKLNFDVNYKIAGDFDFLLKNGKIIKDYFLDSIILQMSNTGSSRKYTRKVIYETSKSLYKSKDFGLLYAILHFVLAYASKLRNQILYN